MPEIVNQTELARLLRVSVPTIATLRDAGMPVVREGTNGVGYEFDADACADWYRVHRQSRAEQRSVRERRLAEIQADLFGDDDDGDDDALGLGASTNDVKRLYEVARMRDEMELSRGLLIKTSRVDADYQQTLSYLRATLLGMTDRLLREAGLSEEQADAVTRITDETIVTIHRMMQVAEIPGSDC